MKLSYFALILLILSLSLSACGGKVSEYDSSPLINISTVTPRYGVGGYKIQIEPIEEVPYNLSDSFVVYYAVYEEGGQMIFTRITVGSNFEGKPNLHYFKIIPIEVVTGPVTAFDENAREAMLGLCLAISE
ncbi:TPA: hypothetical protein DIU27_05370 [Candidatus Collierbacteria bacterium]|uniref:Lipoprotein n=1 Tax=Candidatus Collierbacteria bacterium GW2011_GWB2_44_22 TaxID=1618387 RepID=A0A0G1HZA6_9BACT|nr:MAG: hypothetical protein UW31_C0002G0044 [Candidatus Collierbacteria bacterium GW2011_GWA2_44_13]KKT50191.1 MAG: hypothetical protein UW42_C0023G0008 [Candidatus Collierbacteria bacterium GW2011_GWB1_44_197]KKT51903.1 MAG: hypothetical protein UW44_C0006G0021 [Candidatus Collierbacteria bacterium GW2011_GWB2_44_22]KKT61885.1 MAG: hypothetical protein UW56_C0016G0019 [Candidatus Collierbacteria bacterium GW2011_GWD1_44_27]KKT66173.1 MAG: hypothetical protein UW58_C0012G0015 [Candidatus Colli